MTKKSVTLEIDPTIIEKNMKIIMDNPVEEEIKNLLSSVDTVPSKLVKPVPGLCVKTFSKPDHKKVFVNICLTDAIPCPRDVTDEELMQILSSEDPSSYRVPMSIGEGRTEQDKAGVPVTVYDVAINPDFFKKIDKNDLFQTFFLTVVFEGLQDKYQFELEMQNFTVLKNRKSIGTLQTHRIQIRDIQTCEEAKKSSLIEEICDKPSTITEISSKHKLNKKEVIYRLRREPPTGEIEYLLAEFKIPNSVELKDLNLEVGEDRLVLESQGLYDIVDFFLPCSVDQDVIEAKLNRNNDDNPVEEEIKNLLSSVDTVPSKLVKPVPGLCVKTFSKPDHKKVFVNICLTDAIPCPRDVTDEELMQILSSEDPSSYRVPMSIGEGRTEQDKAGVPVTVYDVAINPDFFKKIDKNDLFQTFFLTVVFEGLQDKYQFELEMQNFTVLKNRKSIGTLQTHRIQIRDIQTCEEAKKSSLIEEICDKPSTITEISSKHKLNKKEVIYRLRREPPTGEIEYLLAEFKIPNSVELKDLNLEVGEDRLVLESQGLYDIVDFFLPCSVDQDVIEAKLNRNNDVLSVKMPVI